MKVMTVLTAGLLAAIFLGCGSQVAERAETTTKRPPAKSELTERLLTEYEHVRSQLATDKAVSGEEFKRIAEAARVASGAYAGEAKGHADQLASSAESAAGKAGEGIAEARDAFGEISRHLVALLAVEPDLATGRYLFECPMAKSYPKWVQKSASVSNPYLGREMATCGTASEWRP